MCQMRLTLVFSAALAKDAANGVQHWSTLNVLLLNRSRLSRHARLIDGSSLLNLNLDRYISCCLCRHPISIWSGLDDSSNSCGILRVANRWSRTCIRDCVRNSILGNFRRRISAVTLLNNHRLRHRLLHNRRHPIRCDAWSNHSNLLPRLSLLISISRIARRNGGLRIRSVVNPWLLINNTRLNHGW